MRRGVVLVAMMPLLLAAGEPTVTVRGKTLALARLSESTREEKPPVLFLPGDGGWRGAAVAMSRTIASWGYEVYGLDTKKYLEAFSQDGGRLTLEELRGDVYAVAREIGQWRGRRVIVVGWSQGASMAVAAAGVRGGPEIQGVITLGLPQTGLLSWDWKTALAVLARRDGGGPSFAVRPLMGEAAPVPVWMIHGGVDEYTTLEAERGLYAAAREPKHLDEIAGANHHFDGHGEALYGSLRKGLEWIAAR